jgi:hypothetical protein
VGGEDTEEKEVFHFYPYRWPDGLITIGFEQEIKGEGGKEKPRNFNPIPKYGRIR